MTSDAGYPDFFTDVFDRVIDSYRCTATHNRRRCQLYDRHDGAHAHAWLEPHGSAKVRRGQRYPFNPHTIRWDESGEAWEHDDSRLPWACMFRV